jgi:hypothetical protein
MFTTKLLPTVPFTRQSVNLEAGLLIMEIAECSRDCHSSLPESSNPFELSQIYVLESMLNALKQGTRV